MTQDEIKVAIAASGLEEVEDGSDFAQLRTALEKLGAAVVGMDRLSRELVAAAATAKLTKLNVKRPARLVDEALRIALQKAKAIEATAPAITPAAEAVDGGELLRDLTAAFEKYLWLPQWGALKLALFVIYTHAFHCFDVSPLLIITSAAMGSGKTRVIEILNHLVRVPYRNLSATTASLLRQIDISHPTVLYDESDNIDATGRRDLIAVLNGGHTRNAAHLSMCVGDDHTPRQYNVYCPKVFAGNLSFFPETTWSRAIIIEMEPRPKDFHTARLTPESGDELMQLTSRVMRWVADHSEQLRSSKPAFPDSLPDRVADNWGPGFAIADVAGADWGSRTRVAAVEGVAADTSDLPEGRELLLNIRQVFTELKKDRIRSVDLIAALTGNPEWRWHYRPGGFNPHVLGKLLKPFRVHSKTIAFPPNAKGFELGQFQHAFATQLQYALDEPTAPTAEPGDAVDTTAEITDITVIANAPESAAGDLP